MADPSPEPRPSPLQAFRDALAGGSVPGEDVLSGAPGTRTHGTGPCWSSNGSVPEQDSLIPGVRSASAWKKSWPRPASAACSSGSWTLPDGPTGSRLGVRRPASDLHPPALQSALAAAIMEAGLPLAMGLEKTPRPLVRLGHPLPPGVEGFNEWADMVLREPPGMPAGALAERINARCAPGLQVLHAVPVPNHASPVLDLWSPRPLVLVLSRAAQAPGGGASRALRRRHDLDHLEDRQGGRSQAGEAGGGAPTGSCPWTGTAARSTSSRAWPRERP